MTDHWRVAHAFDSSLPGWLVVTPRAHLLAMSQLSAEAAAELGPLLSGLSRALADVTGCLKTYLMQFSEAEGFSHLHLHVVPRMSDQPEDERGPGIFTRLGADLETRVPVDEMDRLAAAVGAALRR